MPIPVISSRLIGSFEKHPSSPFTTGDSREWLFSQTRLDKQRMLGGKKKKMKQWGAIQINVSRWIGIDEGRLSFPPLDFTNYSKGVEPTAISFRAYHYRSYRPCCKEVRFIARLVYVIIQIYGEIMRRHDAGICTNEQHFATCYARMIYRFTAQGYSYRAALSWPIMPVDNKVENKTQ